MIYHIFFNYIKYIYFSKKEYFYIYRYINKTIKHFKCKNTNSSRIILDNNLRVPCLRTHGLGRVSEDPTAH